MLGPKRPIYELIGSAPWPGALFGGSRMNFGQGRRDDWGGGDEDHLKSILFMQRP